MHEGNTVKDPAGLPGISGYLLEFQTRAEVHPKESRRASLGFADRRGNAASDWQKRLVDLNVTDLTAEDLQWADYVFVSAMIVQRESARAVIDRCHAAGVKVVAGGPLFTMEYEQFPGVDHFVLNEAEMTLAPFLRDLQAGHAQRVYASTEFPDIHQTPVPLWDWQILNTMTQ